VSEYQKELMATSQTKQGCPDLSSSLRGAPRLIGGEEFVTFNDKSKNIGERESWVIAEVLFRRNNIKG